MPILDRIRASLAPGLKERFRLGSRGRTQKSTLGIDFGAGNLKIVQVAWGEKGLYIDQAAVIPVPAGLMAEGVITAPAKLGEILRAALEGMQVKSRSAGTCIGGPGVLMRYLSLPRLGPEELRAAMKYEAGHHLPIAEEQLLYDFTTLPEAAGGAEGHVELFLAGTQRGLVESYLMALQAAGLEPEAIELDSLAALRAMEYLHAVEPSSPIPFVILDLGETGTRVSIMRHGIPILTRTIPTGLAQLRLAVAATLHLPREEVEMLLRTKGVTADRQFAMAVEPWINGLMESVSRSIEFFLIQNRGISLERLVLLGGGAVLPDLPDALYLQLQQVLSGRVEAKGLRVQQANVDAMPTSPDCRAKVMAALPILLTALGSALREGEK